MKNKMQTTINRQQAYYKLQMAQEKLFQDDLIGARNYIDEAKALIAKDNQEENAIDK